MMRENGYLARGGSVIKARFILSGFFACVFDVLSTIGTRCDNYDELYNYQGLAILFLGLQVMIVSSS